ncbi:MAG: hypothetical protein KC910_01080 [Candidatus Eremiobacteraeota bacterium]|nr:hypothetical protein [Candidatus Eremiobacteraeota bacterium]
MREDGLEMNVSAKALTVAPPADRSPRARFCARPEGSLAIVSGERDSAIDFGRPLDSVTVADNGTVAALTPGEGGTSQLWLACAGAEPRQVAQGFTIGSVDLRSDGAALAYARHDRVMVVDAAGERELCHTPRWIDRVEYLEDDRLLVCSHESGWGIAPIPTYYVVEPNNTMAMLDDVQAAEELGVPVRQPLLTTYKKLFPGIDEATAGRLLDRFGYALPEYRVLSKDHDQVVFNSGQQVFWARLPEARLEQLPALGKIDKVYWPEQGPPAVACERGLAVPAQATLPYRVQTAFWSPDGELAAQAQESDGPTVFVQGSEGFFPVARGELLGWQDGQLRIRRDGEEGLFAPLPLSPADARDYLLGPERQVRPIQVDEEAVDIGGYRIPVQD